MNILIYETKISDARWIAYDIPGNIGWILYFVGLVPCFDNQSQWRQSPLMMTLLMIAVIPAVLMLVGILELISERIAKLDRVLPKIRLIRGFGALTLGGILGTVVPLIAAAVNALTVHADGNVLIIMSVGGLLCAVFAGLLYKGYHKTEC